MKQLHYTTPNNLSKLADELVAAIPALAPVDGEQVARFEGQGNEVYLTVPEAVSDAAVAAVVAAHDPAPVPVVDPDADLAEAIAAASTIAELKAALLGSVNAARVKGRPV